MFKSIENSLQDNVANLTRYSSSLATTNSRGAVGEMAMLQAFRIFGPWPLTQSWTAAWSFWRTTPTTFQLIVTMWLCWVLYGPKFATIDLAGASDRSSIQGWTRRTHNSIYKQSITWIRDTAASIRNDPTTNNHKILVVTHHTPTLSGTASPDRDGRHSNYQTDLLGGEGVDEFIERDTWVFGHTTGAVISHATTCECTQISVVGQEATERDKSEPAMTRVSQSSSTWLEPSRYEQRCDPDQRGFVVKISMW